MTANTVAQPATQDERVLAALAHGSALLPFMGLVGPIIIWITQREKSAYAAFQSLQALAYQVAMLVFGFVGMACYALSTFGMFFALPLTEAGRRPGAEPGGEFFAIFLVPLCTIGLYFIGQALLILYALVGAVKTLQGRPFRYAVIGDRVARFMATGAAEARGAAGEPGAGAGAGAPG